MHSNLKGYGYYLLIPSSHLLESGCIFWAKSTHGKLCSVPEEVVVVEKEDSRKLYKTEYILLQEEIWPSEWHWSKTECKRFSTVEEWQDQISKSEKWLTAKSRKEGYILLASLCRRGMGWGINCIKWKGTISHMLLDSLPIDWKILQGGWLEYGIEQTELKTAIFFL